MTLQRWGGFQVDVRVVSVVCGGLWVSRSLTGVFYSYPISGGSSEHCGEGADTALRTSHLIFMRYLRQEVPHHFVLPVIPVSLT